MEKTFKFVQKPENMKRFKLGKTDSLEETVEFIANYLEAQNNTLQEILKSMQRIEKVICQKGSD